MSFTLDELLAEVASAPSVTPADQDPRLGTMVGPYKVQERIGRGGMGTVYLARDTRLERDVALKMLHDESPLACRELLREARRAATVSHASIAQVYDVNEAPPPYIAMELVKGDSLEERITKNPPGAVESLRILSDTTEAIAALHAKGIVHRDLTPRNIALTEDGRLKILDFGIAMPLGRGTQTEAESESILHAGTERYVAPERANGEAPSAKEDVFSIGVLALDLFAKTAPPKAVAALLERCRSPSVAERPSDLALIAKELRSAQAPAPRRATPPLVFIAIAVAALVAFVWMRPQPAVEDVRPPEPPPETIATADAELARLTFYAEDQSILELSGSGTTFLVTDTRGVSRFDDNNESERFALAPGFRPTSAHETRSGVLVLGTSGEERNAYYYSEGAATRVPLDTNIEGLRVAHDGQRVALLEPTRIRVGVLDSDRQTLLRPDSVVTLQVDGAFSVDAASWSPDDQRLLILNMQDGRGRLEELDATSGKRRTVFESPALLGRLATYAFTYVDDDTIAFSMREPNDASVGLYTLSLSRAEEPHLVAHIPTAIQSLSWCSERAAFRFIAYEADYKIYRQVLGEDDALRMTFSDHQDWVTGFSADGEDIHFSRMTPSGSRAFSVPRSSPSSEVPLSLEATEELPYPTRVLEQGHDGWLAFVPRADAQHELLRVTPEATHSLAEVEATPGRWRAPPFGVELRRSGERTFYGRSHGNVLEILELEGTALRERFQVENVFINWFVFAVSGDAERFVFRDLNGLFLANEEGVVLQRIEAGDFDGLQSADFLPDGSLIVAAGSARQFSLLHVNVSTGETVLLASSHHRWFGGVAASPVRDEFAYTSVGWDTDVYEVALSR
ncbi:MAG: LpqB family beta-propeller domain-containing protein [Polyangiales bacterium]